jgi:Acetyltransferase (GNAT) domain
MSKPLVQNLALETAFVSSGTVGVDAVLESTSSTKNPFALQAVMSVPLPSVKPASALECCDSNGVQIGVWPMHRGRMVPAISVMRSPNVPLYETASTPMIRAGHELEVMESFMRCLKGDSTLSTTIFAQSMLAEGPVWEALQNLADRHIIRLDVIEAWERSVMQRAVTGSAENYLKTLVSPQKRKTLRRKIAKLRLKGNLSLVITNDADVMGQAFDRFCKLEASGWKGERGTALLQHPVDAIYFRTLMITMARADRAFIAELQQKDHSISSGLFLTCDDEITFLRTAYDESLANLSPGVVLDAMLTTDIYNRPGFSLLDSSTDGAVSPGSMLWPQRRKMAHVVIDCGGSSTGARVVVGAQRARLWLKQKKNKLV